MTNWVWYSRWPHGGARAPCITVSSQQRRRENSGRDVAEVESDQASLWPGHGFSSHRLLILCVHVQSVCVCESLCKYLCTCGHTCRRVCACVCGVCVCACVCFVLLAAPTLNKAVGLLDGRLVDKAGVLCITRLQDVSLLLVGRWGHRNQSEDGQDTHQPIKWQARTLTANYRTGKDTFHPIWFLEMWAEV